MMVETSELLERLSATLRNEIGPAVGDEYTRTQAFMASVILGKLAKQQALAPEHEAAERVDMERLQQQLAEPLRGAPTSVQEVAKTSAVAGTVAALGPLIEALYTWGIDDENSANALGAIRVMLRRDIDRKMEIAG